MTNTRAYDTDVQFIDPQDVMAALGRKNAGIGRRQSEVVSYWRRPNKGRFSGYVLWSDTQPGKRDDMMSRGFTPLFKFGRVWDGPDDDGKRYREFGPWGAILCHPEGPSQFPVEQIIVQRWYSEEGLRYSCNGNLPRGKKPSQLFPQLRAYLADGNKIREFLCPDCESVTFLEAVHLARHLRNSHNWERPDLLTWGREMGIDFSREFKTRMAVVEFDPDDLDADGSASPEDEDNAPILVEQVQTPQKPKAEFVSLRQSDPKPQRAGRGAFLCAQCGEHTKVTESAKTCNACRKQNMRKNPPFRRKATA